LHSYLNRWLQPDDIIPDPANPVSWDRYAYCGNNPVNRVDPDGHADREPGDDGTGFWHSITVLWILNNIQDPVEQNYYLVHYLVEHPDYDPRNDQELIDAGYDIDATSAGIAISQFHAQAYATSQLHSSLSELAESSGAGAIAGALVLSGGFVAPEVYVTNSQLGKKVAQHGRDYGLDPKIETDRQKFRDLITDVSKNYEEVRTGPWRGSKENHYFYRKGNMVVVAKGDGEFVTILDDGINNGWFSGASVMK